MHAHRHSQPHGEPHAGHTHGQAPGSWGGHGARQLQTRKLTVVLVLTGLYMIVEVIGGFLTGSLALFADAGHTLSDVASLVLGLFAVWVAQRPASSNRTYGHTRVEILAALAQGTALVAVALLIFSEAVGRIGTAPEVNGLGMMAVASGGLLANAVGMLILNRGRQQSINIRGVWLHLATDALGSLGVIGAGAAVWAFAWTWADAAIAMVISGLVLFAAWQLLRDALDILMEAAPGHLDVDEIREAMASLPDVASVHDLHVWTIGNGEIALSTHLVSSQPSDSAALLREVRAVLGDRFAIRHTTVQIEIGDGEESDCEGACDTPAPLGAAGSAP